MLYKRRDATINSAIAPGASANMPENFFAYQQRWMKKLLSWALGSIAVGALCQLFRSPFWKQFGIQAIAWGTIDAALALLSIRSAARKDDRYRQEELRAEDVQKEAHGLYRLLLLNTFLDMGYCALALWLWQRFHARVDRKGLAVGILLQGLWLLLFDGWFTIDIRKRWLKH